MVRGSSRLAAAAAAAPAPAPSRKRGAAANAEPANAPAAGPSGSSPSKRAAAQEEPPKRRKTAKGGHFVRTRRFEPTCFAGAVPHEPLKLQNLEEGEIYIMGSGEMGQLGLGPDITGKERPSRLNELRGKRIVDIVAGGLSSYAISTPDEEGKQQVYSWGCNDQGALGRNTTDDSDKETFCNYVVEGLENAGEIVRIIAGDSVTLALNSEGKLFGTGTFRDAQGIFGFLPHVKEQKSFVPLDFEAFKDRFIVSVAVGANHVIAVDSEGGVYTWGVGEQGQLGRRTVGRKVEDVSLQPRRINFRKANKIVKFSQVYGGAYHTLLVTDDGRTIYSMGLNNYGQLGLGHTENTFAPERIPLDLPEGVKVAECSGGQHHSMILLDNGDVYAFGRNDSYQLGLPIEGSDAAETASAHVTEPTKIADIPPMKQISCGSAFTLAVTRDLDLWGWGYGERGQLGSEGEVDVPEPEQIEIRERKCIKVSAGGQHTMLLIRKKEEL